VGGQGKKSGIGKCEMCLKSPTGYTGTNRGLSGKGKGTFSNGHEDEKTDGQGKNVEWGKRMKVILSNL